MRSQLSNLPHKYKFQMCAYEHFLEQSDFINVTISPLCDKIQLTLHNMLRFVHGNWKFKTFFLKFSNLLVQFYALYTHLQIFPAKNFKIKNCDSAKNLLLECLELAKHLYIKLYFATVKCLPINFFNNLRHISDATSDPKMAFARYWVVKSWICLITFLVRHNIS